MADQSAWERIKSHKVVQWTAAYAAASYVLLHGVEMVANALEWPHLVVRILTLLLLLGAPLVVTLAWFHGHRAHERVGRLEMAILGSLLVTAGIVLWYLGRPASEAIPTGQMTASTAQKPGDVSIAVLPFINMSSDPEQEYFSDGMTEQILSLLARIPDLRVIARTSSFAFKGRKDVDVATIAQRLNVSHVLEGSVQKSGNRVRITAQLIRSSDSSHQWSENYDRELTDVFAVQDEIATAVVQQLKLALLNDRLPASSSTTSIDAYNWYLRGQYLSYQHTEESLYKAIDFYEKALAADPAYAEALAALANVQASLAEEGLSGDFATDFERARASARRALELNPSVAKAHLALGIVQTQYDWDWVVARESFNRAHELDSSDAITLMRAGLLNQTLGDLDAGIVLCKRAVDIDPVAPVPRSQLGFSYLTAGRLDEAEHELRAALELSPDLSYGWHLLGIIHLLQGQPERALETFQQGKTEVWRLAGPPLALHALGRKKESDAALKELIDKEGDVSLYQIAQAYAYRGEKEEAIAWLERAFRQRDPGMLYLGLDPLVDVVRSDPRVVAMLRKMNLPDLRRG